MVDRTALKGADLMITNRLPFSDNKGKKEILCSFDDNCEKIIATEPEPSPAPKPAAEIVSQLKYSV